jgi:putative SOS response-associated peptidase YedK
MTFAGLAPLARARTAQRQAAQIFAIITTPANNLLRPLHGRMPVVLALQCWARWLGGTPAVERELKAMLRRYSSRHGAWPVDRKVSNVRNDRPDLFSRCGNEPPAARLRQREP